MRPWETALYVYWLILTSLIDTNKEKYSKYYANVIQLCVPALNEQGSKSMPASSSMFEAYYLLTTSTGFVCSNKHHIQGESLSLIRYAGHLAFLEMGRISLHMRDKHCRWSSKAVNNEAGLAGLCSFSCPNYALLVKHAKGPCPGQNNQIQKR